MAFVAEQPAPPDRGASCAPRPVIVPELKRTRSAPTVATIVGVRSPQRLDRRRFLSASIVIFAAPAAIEEQQPARIPRIAYVAPATGPNPVSEPFYLGLREAGYIEGRTIVIDDRYMGGREDQYGRVMAELEQQRVDATSRRDRPRPWPPSAWRKWCQSSSQRSVIRLASASSRVSLGLAATSRGCRLTLRPKSQQRGWRS
jgi:hypothetical protein